MFCSIEGALRRRSECGGGMDGPGKQSRDAAVDDRRMSRASKTRWTWRRLALETIGPGTRRDPKTRPAGVALSHFTTQCRRPAVVHGHPAPSVSAQGRNRGFEKQHTDQRLIGSKHMYLQLGGEDGIPISPARLPCDGPDGPGNRYTVPACSRILAATSAEWGTR